MKNSRYANIMYICGNNSFLVEREKKWIIDLFKGKYGDKSVEICSLDAQENFKKYADNILSVDLFSSSRLFVFTGGASKKPKKTKKSNEKNTPQSFDIFLEKIANHLWATDFLLFYDLGAGEDNLKKWLEKYATPREKNISFADRDWEKYTSLSTNVLKKILSLYADAEKFRDKWQENPFLGHAIFQTISDLEILEKNNIPITTEIIEKFSHPFEGATVFAFLDAILAENILQAKKILTKIESQISDQGSLEIFVWGLISNLRKNLYILRLRDSGFSSTEISEKIPGIHPFILKKALQSKIKANSLGKFFQKIIISRIAYRSGKWMKKTILWRFFEIDTALLELKK